MMGGVGPIIYGKLVVFAAVRSSPAEPGLTVLPLVFHCGEPRFESPPIPELPDPRSGAQVMVGACALWLIGVLIAVIVGFTKTGRRLAAQPLGAGCSVPELATSRIPKLPDPGSGAQVMGGVGPVLPGPLAALIIVGFLEVAVLGDCQEERLAKAGGRSALEGRGGFPRRGKSQRSRGKE
eukprot:43912-Heterocapsa_arctica.AAC.1